MNQFACLLLFLVAIVAATPVLPENPPKFTKPSKTVADNQPATPVLPENPPKFTKPSKTVADNQPVGNGELTANVWVEHKNQTSLNILFGRTDVFSGHGQPLKLGRVKVTFSPDISITSFIQELDLITATVYITINENVFISVWSDATSLSSSDSLQVDIASDLPVSATIQFTPWRTEYLPSQDDSAIGRGPCLPDHPDLGTPLQADEFLKISNTEIGIFYKSNYSIFAGERAEGGGGGVWGE